MAGRIGRIIRCCLALPVAYDCYCNLRLFGTVEMRLIVSTQFLACVLFVSTVLCGQDAAEFADGPMQLRSDAIGNLVRMNVKGKVLTLDRQWDQEDKTEEKEDQLDIEAKKLMARGFDARIADQLARQRMGTMLKSSHPIAKEFDKLKFAGGSSSAGVSISNKRMVSHFSNRIMRAKIEVDDSRIVLNIKENEEPKREVIVSDNDSGVFVVEYSGEDFSVELKQKADGSIQLSRVRGDKQDVFKASSYIALRKENPKVINQWLVPLLQHIGFTIPIVSDDEPVQRAVLNKLVGMRSRSMKDFEQLVRDLDSDQFRTREDASAKLAAQATVWQDAIVAKLKSGKLSVEARIRLRNVLAEEKSNNPIDDLIESQDLLNSVDYLVDLFPIANEQEKTAISKQLEQITNHTEPSPEAWLVWLNNKSKNKNRAEKESP